MYLLHVAALLLLPHVLTRVAVLQKQEVAQQQRKKEREQRKKRPASVTDLPDHVVRYTHLPSNLDP